MRRRRGLWSERSWHLVGFLWPAQVTTGGRRQSCRIAAPRLAPTMPLSFPPRLHSSNKAVDRGPQQWAKRKHSTTEPAIAEGLRN
jgi:hypothetical protein